MATCERYPPKYPPACSTCSTWMALVIATLRISPRHRCSYLGFDGGDFIRDKPFDGVSKKKIQTVQKNNLGCGVFQKESICYLRNQCYRSWIYCFSCITTKINRLFQMQSHNRNRGFRSQNLHEGHWLLDSNTSLVYLGTMRTVSEIVTILCHPEVASNPHFWLVVSNMTGLFSISYMGCHPSHWRTPSFFRGVDIPPTSFVFWSFNSLCCWGFRWKNENHGAFSQPSAKKVVNWRPSQLRPRLLAPTKLFCIEAVEPLCCFFGVVI